MLGGFSQKVLMRYEGSARAHVRMRQESFDFNLNARIN
jgi:hypothetical protein